jgi:branched-subunit amino acid aminotransferase/4-amino-4-deoxychorismate lyase
MDLPVNERRIYLKDISRMSEVFMTSSVRGILPVVQIGDRLVGNGKVGKFTKEISRLYNMETRLTREKYGKLLRKRMNYS